MEVPTGIQKQSSGMRSVGQVLKKLLIMAALYVMGQAIIFLPCDFYLLSYFFLA